MGKNRYFLLGRDKDTNNVKTIGLSDFDIYSFGTGIRKLDNSLESIDYMTLGYSSQEELVHYLVSTGRLDNYNTDLFIVCRNGDKIYYLENIYADSIEAKELRRYSEEKLKGLPCYFSNYKILDDFAYRMINDRRFYRFIESKCHNVYLKYINYFKNCNNLGDAYQIKNKDSSWALNSYPLIRNIVEAMDRYEKIKNIGGSISDVALEYQVDLNSVRDMSKEDISIYTEKGYGEGQLNLFLDNEESNKPLEVIDFLSQLDTDSFVLEKDKVLFNRDKFNCSDLEYKQLNNLDSRLLRLIYMLLVTKRFNEVDGYSELTNNNITKSIVNNIQSLFSESDILLNKAYAFCQLYGRLSDKKIDSKIYKKVKGE